MIERYILPDMGQVWSEENKLSNWLRIELLACEGWARLGRIPASALRVIKANASFEVKRVREIESEVRHDVIAFLTNVAEQVGEESRYIHMGMTSSDVLDTGLALQMREAADLILDKLERLQAVIGRQAGQHKYTLMVGRTHGVHAEPTTFGLKMALWYTEMKRNQERIARVREVISYGKISGAVGTFASIDPAVEEYVCQELGLKPCPVSTQVIQRDRQAEFMAALAVVASSVEKMAVEIRNLQRTDIREVEEPFYPGQKGSSAMPHKRNPMISERVTGLARVVRSNALAAMENVALWHERDLTHSSVERVIIPDSCILLDYILDKFKTVMENLVVYPDHMRTNLDKTSGLIFSQRVMLGLVERGMTREEAYRLVQKNSMQAWNQGIALQELVAQDPEIAKYLDDKALQNIFDYTSYTRQVDYVFRRCGLEPG